MSEHAEDVQADEANDAIRPVPPAVRRKEPGNRIGAAGLLLTLLAGVGFLIEIPPWYLDFGDTAGWLLLSSGVGLTLAGLGVEWLGPKRWSALIPALVAIAFTGVVAWFAAERSTLAYGTRSLMLRADGLGRQTATVYVPRGVGPGAGVVILPEPGPEGFRESRLAARQLARRGIAALVYEADPRVTTADRIRAAADAAVRFSERDEVLGNRVGLMGTGSSAPLAPLAAAQTPDVAFVVSVSPSVLPPEDIWDFRDRPRLRAAGLSEAEVNRALTLRRRYWRTLEGGEGRAELLAEFSGDRREPWFQMAQSILGLPSTVAVAGGRTDAPEIRAIRDHRRYDPLEALRTSEVPLMVMYGTEDERVPAHQSAQVLMEALDLEGHPDASIRMFVGAGYGLKVSSGPDLIPPRYARGYFDILSAWIDQRLGLSG